MISNFIHKKCANVLKKFYHLRLKGEKTGYNKKGTLGPQAPISRRQTAKFLSYKHGPFIMAKEG